MQGRKFLLAVLGGLVVLSVASPALASLSAPMGWYAEGNVGLTRLYNQKYSGSVNGAGIGGNLNIGYKFMPYFTAEIGYTLYANNSIDASDGVKAANNKHYSYDIAAKEIVPIAYGGAEGFAKIGVQRLSSQISVTNNDAASDIGLTSKHNSVTGLYLGAGIQYYLTPDMACVLQWARAAGNNSTGSMDLWSVGVSYIFG